MQILSHSYTNTIYNSRVLMLGVNPSSLGGVSVHMLRAKFKLEKQGCKVSLYDVCIGNYFKIFFYRKFSFYIYQTLHLRRYPIELCFILLSSWLAGSRVIVVIHSARFIENMGLVRRKLLQFLLGRCSKVVLSGSTIQHDFAKNGIALPQNTISESPFIEPDINDKSRIVANTPAKTMKFINRSSPLICISVTRITSWQGGDLYGLDLAISAFNKILQSYPQAGLLVVVGNSGGIENFKFPPRSHVLSDWPQEMWPIIGLADLFIRPTRSDSYGISIAEAIWQGVPAIASDVCVRPKGTALFRSGDVGDLSSKMLQSLAASSASKAKSKRNSRHTQHC